MGCMEKINLDLHLSNRNRRFSCLKCGSSFLSKCQTAKYCEICRQEIRKARTRRWYSRNRASKRPLLDRRENVRAPLPSDLGVEKWMFRMALSIILHARKEALSRGSCLDGEHGMKTAMIRESAMNFILSGSKESRYWFGFYCEICGQDCDRIREELKERLKGRVA